MGQLMVSTSLCRLSLGMATGVEAAQRDATAAGSEAIERAVRSSLGVALPPLLDDVVCFLHGCEFFAVPALVSELAVEALHIVILPGAAWLSARRALID